MEINGPSEYSDTLLYILYVFDRGGEIVASSQARITLRCPFAWFLTPTPDGCPDQDAASLEAIEQLFEGRRILWLSGGPLNNGPIIYVLYDQKHDGKMWTVFDKYLE